VARLSAPRIRSRAAAPAGLSGAGWRSRKVQATVWSGLARPRSRSCRPCTGIAAGSGCGRRYARMKLATGGPAWPAGNACLEGADGRQAGHPAHRRSVRRRRLRLGGLHRFRADALDGVAQLAAEDQLGVLGPGIQPLVEQQLAVLVRPHQAHLAQLLDEAAEQALVEE